MPRIPVGATDRISLQITLEEKLLLMIRLKELEVMDVFAKLSTPDVEQHSVGIKEAGRITIFGNEKYRRNEMNASHLGSKKVAVEGCKMVCQCQLILTFLMTI